MGRKKSALKIDDDEYSLPQDDESKDDHQTQIRNQNNMFIGLDDANGDAVSRIEEEKSSSMMVDDGDPIDMVFSGKKKKKSSKNKKVSTFSALDDVDEDREGNGKDTVIELEEEENKVEFVEEVVPTKKQNKKNKKKNKSGRTNQEEEDLDRILAELNGAPTTVTFSVPVSVASSSKPVVEAPVVEVVDMGKVEESEGIVDEGKVEEVEVAVESAAEKKKRKKKEKEKEKKAAAAAVKELNEAKGKMADNKKVPKAVREMQEKIARRKEIEDKRRMEEEERLRKEEEERLRLEEIERQAEEIKRKKKEREKEKLRKKKEDGLLLTGKAKQEAKRLESMRNQFLQNSEANLLTSGTEAKKKPVYKKKKHGSAKQADDLVGNQQISHHDGTQEEAVLHISEEIDLVDEGESSISPEGEAEEKQEVLEPEVIEEDEEEDDWDAKSWDNVDVTLPVTNVFEDEEEELVAAKPVAKKVIDQVAKAEQHGNEKIPAKSTVKKGSPPHLSESKEKDDKVAASFDSNHQKENAKKNSDDTSKKGGNGNLRSPICCILGHVDTGKTKLLDCIRGTNVQEGEAGGITQQIGATYFPTDNIRERTKELKADAMLKVPGLLVIDTPGHEAFTNLRSRGSSLCDIAILVVDIMHGLEPQTIESLNLLKSRNAEFIVALNKVDRLYGWKKCPNAPIVKAMKLQSVDVQNEFKMRVTQIITQFKEQGLNTELYYKNKNMGETSSIVPTSAMSGEGIPDLLLLLVNWAQRTMEEKLTFMDDIQCTVLEVKVIEGLGTTIDVVLVNGVLHEGDQIVVCGMQGPIATNIRALLTPHPMKELRVKGTYLHHKEVKAAQGIKITAQGLEHAVAGTALYVVGPDDDLDDVKDLAMQDMKNVMSRIDKSGEGVCVQASTIGSLEALLEFLKTPAVNIPVSGINIGPVHKKDVMKASVMLERKKEYATILAFDVKVTPEARELAEDSGVQIFIADIIYHLFDQFKAYMESIKAEKKKETAEEAVFPCHLKIMPNCIFNKKDPIVLGVDVVEGIAKVGTPICIPSREFIDIGRITSIEINHKQVDTAKKGLKVAIKILGSNAEEQQKMFGRHFEMEDDLYSHISRKSIDILKANYRDELSTEEWQLVVRLKKLFSIP